MKRTLCEWRTDYFRASFRVWHAVDVHTATWNPNPPWQTDFLCAALILFLGLKGWETLRIRIKCSDKKNTFPPVSNENNSISHACAADWYRIMHALALGIVRHITTPVRNGFLLDGAVIPPPLFLCFVLAGTLSSFYFRICGWPLWNFLSSSMLYMKGDEDS